MEVEYDITLDDMVEFNVLALSHHPPTQHRLKVLRIYYISSMTILIILGILSILINSPLTSIVPFAAAVVFAVLLWYRFNRSQVRKRIKKAVTKQYGRFPNDEICRHEVTISGEGLHVVTDFDDSMIRWPAFSEIIQTDKYLFFFLRPGKALLVPKRAFVDDAAFNRFAQAARDYRRDSLKFRA